ncbi:MAG TPA: SLC13 family permease, partial [Acidobacteriota bacterium]|nr:SLC13 family permease [Acidobacteriota bacterium]
SLRALMIAIFSFYNNSEMITAGKGTLTLQIGIVICLLIGAVLVFAFELLTVDMVGLGIVAILIVTGILTPDQAFSGFSNPAVIMIAGLLVISGGLYHSGVPDAIGRSIYKYSGRSVNRLLVFIMCAEVAVSAFMNNVAATAMFLPGVTALAKNARVSASKLLIPLAYASMLGGTCTLIGTSTNMAVNGLLRTYRIEPFGFFEYTPIGMSIALTGVIFMLLAHRWVLPGSPAEAEQEIPREYLTEAVILFDSPMAGKTLAQSGLDKLDLMVLGIVRHGASLHSPSGEESIEADDILLIQGQAPDILKIKGLPGLEIREDIRNNEVPITNIVEVEVAPRSDFIGKTLKEMNFRQRYGLSVIAIYRKHERVISKIGDLKMRFGDVLLIQGPQARVDQIKFDYNFLLLNELSYRPYDRKKGIVSLSIFGVVVVLGGFGVFPIAAVAFLGALAMVLTRILPLKNAYGSMEWSLLMLIAGMMSLGMAMESTGTAEFLARKIISFHEHPSPLFLLGAFFILTVLLTQPLSNAAAALVVLPMAVHVAIAQGVNPRSYAMAVSIAASCSFLTPLEPACALVYNPGKYRVWDFLRAGLGLTTAVFIICMLLIPLLWPF